MPKISWARPKPNYLRCLLTDVRKAKHKTYEDLGRQFGCSVQNVRQQINRPPEKWTIGQILKYCDALGIPYEDAVLAAIRK